MTTSSCGRPIDALLQVPQVEPLHTTAARYARVDTVFAVLLSTGSRGGMKGGKRAVIVCVQVARLHCTV